MQNAIINGLCRLSISSSHDYQWAYKALIVSAKPKTYRTLCRPYELYGLRPLSTAANQQLEVSTGTIATYLAS